jgi:hypothetical protein
MPPRPPSNRTPLLLGVGAVVLVAVVVLVVVLTRGSGGSGSDRTLTIGYTAQDPNGVDCSDGGTGALSDVRPGMPVRVFDQNGTVVASTTLPDSGSPTADGTGCTWAMQVTVPDDVTQYGIEGGGHGTVTFSHDTLDSNGWTADLEVG